MLLFLVSKDWKRDITPKTGTLPATQWTAIPSGLAYKNELDRFIDCINSKESPDVTFEDGRNALIIANAAYESLENKKSVKIDYS